MASKSQNTGSPWTSSTFLPFKISSRRNSVTSLSSRAALDRETLSQALDDIHSSASQAPTLITFNDFAAPPPAPKSEDRPLTPGGLSGLYARFRSGADKDLSPSPSSHRHRKTASEADKINAPSTPSATSFVTNDRAPPSNVLSPGRPPTPQTDDIGLRWTHEEPGSTATDQPGPSPVDNDLGSRVASPSPSMRRSSRQEMAQRSQIPEKNANVASRNHQISSPSFVPSVFMSPLHSAASDGGSDHALAASERNVPPLESAGQNDHANADPEPACSDVFQKPFKKPAIPRLTTGEILQTRAAARAALTEINVPGSNTSDVELEAASAHSSAQTPNRSRSSSRAANQQNSNSLIHEMRRKVLSRDFWMKDENAKVCFNCGDVFTAFRRKHHCRTCGQIYDSKCTVLIPGRLFGQPGTLRVCKTCENILVGDDSSEYSEDEESLPQTSHSKSIRFSGLPSNPPHAQSRTSLVDSPGVTDPGRSSADTRRRAQNPLENAVPSLARPSSSRSLKSLGGRPLSSGHRHRRSYHQHMRSLPSYHGNLILEPSSLHKRNDADASPHHTDSIIDPDIAPFMSDEGSSEDESYSIAAAMNSHIGDRHPFSSSTGTAVPRKSKPRPSSSRSVLDLGLHGRDPDTISIRSSRPGTRRRATTRTMSIGSTMGRPPTSPRVIRSENLFADGPGYFGSTLSLMATDGNDTTMDSPLDTHKPGSPPAMAELNRASINHVRVLLRQLLDDAAVESPKRWEKALVPILLRCAEDVDPNIQRGDDIDIRHYVKLKKAPSGKPRYTAYISGVVFSKNMALKGMRTSIPDARLLLVSFPIVYARHQQHFMSLDAVIAQEKEYLRNLVRRVVALKPDVVLAEKQVAGFALELLQEQNVTVAFNVKETVLQAVSRCTQSRIITSVDQLAMDFRHLGACEKFDIKTYLFDSYRKTYFFIAGCRNDLGCTILLRGGDLKTLKKLKWITEFMCYVVYNLKLETSLIRDQFSVNPAVRDAVAREREDHHLGSQNEIESSDKHGLSAAEKSPTNRQLCEFGKTINELRRRVLSISPSVKLAEPYLLLRGSEQEKHLRDLHEQYLALNARCSEPAPAVENEGFKLVTPDISYTSTEHESQQVLKTLQAIKTAEYFKADQHYNILRRRWESFIAGSRNPYSPLSHQQIVVLFSVVSLPSMNVCEGPEPLALGFYQEHNVENDWEPDMPLGEYVERLCEQATSSCLASRCDKKMLDHSRHYVHGDGQISVATERLPSKLRGMESTILMWSVCRECTQETPVVPMSRNTWKYSFAKYLELSFWSHSMEPRAGVCPHDINRHHTRYFGFNNLAVRVTYRSIKVMEVSMPRDYVSWKVDKDIVTKNDEYTKIRERIERFTTSVNARIDSIKLGSVRKEDIEKCKLELNSYRERVEDERMFLVDKLQDKYCGSKYFEVIPLNRAVRALQEKVSRWDKTFADFEKRYFPSEKDIRKLAAQRLKDVYLARSEFTESEQLDEKDDNTSPIAHTADSGGEAPAPELETRQVPAIDLTTLQNLPRSNTAIPVPLLGGHVTTSGGSHSSRTVDELDLASSPETSRTRYVPAASVADERGINTPSAELLVTDPPSDYKNCDVTSHATNADDTASSNLTQRRGGNHSPKLIRARTQPALSEGSSSPIPSHVVTPLLQLSRQLPPSLIPVSKVIPQSSRTSRDDDMRIGPTSSTLQGTKGNTPSLIPRSKHYRRNDSRVSALAKHFDQMSRQFEKDRLRERRQRAARVNQAQVYSTASVQPVVEVFKDAEAAVFEHDQVSERVTRNDNNSSSSSNRPYAERIFSDARGKAVSDEINDDPAFSGDSNIRHDEDTAEGLRSEGSILNTSNTFFDMDTIQSDVEPALTDSEEFIGKAETEANPLESQLDIVDLPKHDRTSIMKMLSNFWSERSASGWAPLEYPLAETDHIFGEQDVILREDELSSLIAFSLESPDYKSKAKHFKERAKTLPLTPAEIAPEDLDVERTLLGDTATHLFYKWEAGTATMQCKVFFAESFDAIRQRCGVADRFVESLSRCVKWDSRGGKSKSIFLKTMDERFIVKSLPMVEASAFVRFAPDYFDYMSKCLFHSLPSALAKMLGLYYVVLKNPATGTEFSGFLQVMENVFYEGVSSKMFDLKGSMRNRRAQSTGEKNEVLLDENLLDYLSQTPMYIRNHSNSFLTSSISNDTLFCAKQNVMDYSLIVGLYDDRQELMVGIIDYIRTYTWDKKLESWIKDRGKNKPTVRSPKEYRNRFRASIAKYFPLAPSCWQIFGTQRTEPPRLWWDSIGSTARAEQAESVSMQFPDIEAESGDAGQPAPDVT